MSRFVIELLGLEKGKAYGYQEYIFNLLHYFYHNKDDINYKNIIIWCKSSEVCLFDSYRDKFLIQGFKYSSYLHRFWLQTILPIKFKLNSDDLLFSPGNTSGLIKVCPEILTIHDLLFKRKKWMPNKLMRIQRQNLLPLSIKKADAIVSISKFTKEDILYYYPQAEKKMVVIYNFFNFNKFEGDVDSELLGDYFLTISSNLDYKNQITILKAFHKYCNDGGGASLVIVGRINNDSEAGCYLSTLPHGIKEKIVIKCNISNAELGAIYRGASCFISASKFEGLGMPVVEAMSFGIPVLLSDIPPHREVSMNKGIYFKPEDTEGLTLKMLKMNFGVRDYAKDIRLMFSEENTSARYVELINRVGGGQFNINNMS